MAQMALAVTEAAEAEKYHYFSAQGCVLVDGARRCVFVGGLLVSSYDVTDKATRNAILLKLSEDPTVHLGRLVEAFELSREQLRKLQKKYETGGLPAAMEIKKGGRERVVTPALRRKLYELFDAGATIDVAHAKIKAKISRTMVGRTRKAWGLASARSGNSESPSGVLAAEMPAAAPVAQRELELVLEPESAAPVDVPAPLAASVVPGNDAAVDGASAPSASPSQGLVTGPSLHDAKEVSTDLVIGASKQYVQHAGTFIVLALLQAFGLYRHAETFRKDAVDQGEVDRRYLGKTALRVALDAAVIALVIGQKCIEGVRRVATPSAKTLLRLLSSVPSESWVPDFIAAHRQRAD